MATQDEIRISRDLLREVTEYCSKRLPEEACGIFRGTADCGFLVNSFEGIPNASSEPMRRFAFQPEAWVQALLDPSREPVIGLFHSHPSAPPEPSAEDLEAAWDFPVYAIVSFRDGTPQWNFLKKNNG